MKERTFQTGAPGASNGHVTPRLAILLGGSIDQARRAAIQHGEQPRIDVLEMESRLGARLYDYQWFKQRAGEEHLTRLLAWGAQRLGLWSEGLVLRAFWATRDVDVVYATGEDVGLPLAALLRITRRSSPRIILRMEQPTYGRTPMRRFIFNTFLRFALKRVDLTLCRTRAHARMLRDGAGVPEAAAVFAPQVTDTRFYDCAAGATDAVELPAKPYIVSGGLEMRDYETLIEAVRGLPVRAVIGAGSPWSKFRFDIAGGRDLPENVQVSSFTPVQMRELYRAADLVVMPVKPTARACGMNVVLEAWAMERPVIASRTVGLPDYIQAGETGRFVTPGNVDELRAAILDLLADPAEAARLAANGYQHVQTELNLDHFVENLGATLTSVARQSGRWSPVQRSEQRDRRINVLFMQSQTYFGADSQIHGLLMEHFDRNRVNVHVACNTGTAQNPSAAFRALSAIPDLHLRPTRFGTSVNARSKLTVLRETLSEGIPALASLAGLVRYVKQQQIDIIHCTEKPRDAFYGLLLARATGAKCVIHLHVKAESWISPLVRWAMRHADALVGVSEFVAQSIVAMGYPADKTHVVLNSLDLTGWNSDIDGSSVRREFNIGPDIPVLAIISRLFPWKGHTELLMALAKVKAQVPEFKLLLVGEDDPRATPGRGSYTAELKALTQTLGLMEHIIFTGFRSDVRQIFAACNIFAMPSFEEPFGMVYLEAMAMKKPIIALDNGGAREVVEHGATGLLSPPQDIDQLAANIVTLINNPELQTQMGEYGRTHAERFFTPQRMADDVEQVYRHLLGLSSSAREYQDTAELVEYRPG